MRQALHYCLFLVLGIRICQTLDILNFHDYCGATITKNAGEIRFDAQKLPFYLPRHTCSVSIRPQSQLLNGKTQVFFYFTKFDISIFCEDTNVTVIDGPSFGGTHIKGLPTSMCGHNKTLEEPQYFETHSNQLTITFRRSEYGRRFSGNFNIKFVEFHTGKCEGNNEYKCKNGHCIANVYHCSSEVTVCDADICTEDVDASLTFIESMLDSLRTFGIVFAVIVGLSVVGWVFKKCGVRMSLTRHQTQTEMPSSIGTHSVELEGSPAHYISISTEEVQPSAPPPSYEEIMAPTYADVMAKPYAYK